MKTPRIAATALACISLFANSLPAQDVTKRIEQSHQAHSLSITNSFGKVEVQSHGGDRIDVVVEISVSGNPKLSSQKWLDQVTIVTTEKDGKVELITKSYLGNQKGVKNFSVNYTVRMPENTHISVRNSFGNTSIARSTGTVDVNQQHGSCYIGEALGKDNQIKVTFGSLTGNTIAHADINVQHGSTTLQSVSHASLKQQFGSVKLTQVSGEVRINATHGSVRIEEVTPATTLLDLVSQFGSVELEKVPERGFRIDLEGQFTSFKWPDHFDVREKNEASVHNASYALESDKGPTPSRIKINASHGSVRIR